MSSSEAAIVACAALCKDITDICQGKETVNVLTALTTVIAKVIAVYEITKPGAGAEVLEIAVDSVRQGGEAALAMVAAAGDGALTDLQ